MSSSVSTPTFSGQSSYASSLQDALTRAVNIASLPMQQIQANANTLQSQQTVLNSLESTFTTLQNAITSLNTAAKGSPSAASSDSNVVSAVASSGAMAGTYSITVDRIGTAASSMSKAPVSPATPVTDVTTQNVSSSSTYTLSIDGKTTPITISANNLQALADAINAAGTSVQATIVNVGSTTADYRLSLSSSDFSVQSIQLNDGTSDLLNTLTSGVTSQYHISGGDVINGNSNQINLAPNLTVSLKDTSTSPVTVTVSQSYSQLSSALSSLANAYNSALSAVTQQMGQSGGALAGQSLVYNLSGMLRGISQYSNGSGNVNSLVDLGLTVDKNGNMSLDSSKLSGLNMNDVQSFLGSTTSGGFLQSANNSVSTYTDSTTGSIHVSFTTLQDQIDTDNNHIADAQARINTLQANLIARLSAADAAIAALESQKNYMTMLFQAQYPATSSNG